MNKFVVFCRSSALMSCLFCSSGIAGQEAKIIEYGIYNDARELIKQTKIVPAGEVVQFGFCFEVFVNFFDDNKYMLTQTLAHPEIADDGGWPNIGYNVPRKFKVVNGTAFGCVGYNARAEKEAPAGEWIFSLSDGNDELVQFTFILK